MQKIGFLITFVFLFCTSIASAEIKYQFVRIEKLVEQEVAARMLTDIYKSIGIDISIEPVPGERAKMMATEGSVDGETLRIFSYGEKNPMMVRVPTPYSSLETTAFTKKTRNISISSKEDLNKYKIVIVRGVQHTKDMAEGLKDVHIISDLELMMKFLDVERADVALTNTIAGSAMLKQLKFDTIAPAGTLETLDLFHYVHEKNRDLVPKVDEAIKKLKQSGELKELRDKYEKEYLEKIK